MHKLLIFCTLVVSICGQFPTSNTILDYLRNHRYTNLLHYLDQTGLTATLNGTGPYTLFIPRSYYTRLDPSITNDTAKLTNLLKYNIVSGNYTTHDFNFNENKLPSLLGSDIRVNHYLSTGRTVLEGQALYSANHIVSNGVIHMVNSLLMPPPGTILDVIAMNTSLSTLYSAIQAAGLDSFLQDQSPITLFAPNNQAFSYLEAGKLQALMNNPTLLSKILKYHVIPGTLYAAGYHDGYMHNFEEKDTLRISRSQYGYEVETAQIGGTTSATNGVVHQIDQLLIPASLAAEVNALTSS